MLWSGCSLHWFDLPSWLWCSNALVTLEAYSGPIYIVKHKLAVHQDILDAIHGWSGPDSENNDLATASGLALCIRTTSSSTSSNRGGHEMMSPNIDWHKPDQEEIETSNAAHRASSIRSTLGNGLVFLILFMGTIWDISIIHLSISPCAAHSSRYFVGSKAILNTSILAPDIASAIATWAKSGGQHYLLFRFLMMAGWIIVALQLELHRA